MKRKKNAMTILNNHKNVMFFSVRCLSFLSLFFLNPNHVSMIDLLEMKEREERLTVDFIY